MQPAAHNIAMMARADALELPPTDGRYFTYVFPCAWEDYGKIGFSRDPLARIRALHPRWFEFFDLEAGLLLEADAERDARDLELALRRPLKAHRAPSPLTIQARAGGKTEWVRGANAALLVATRALADQGYRLHPLRPWLAAAMRQRVDQLYEWTQARWTPELADAHDATPAARALRDVLDAYAALGIDIDPWLPDAVRDWYRG